VTSLFLLRLYLIVSYTTVSVRRVVICFFHGFFSCHQRTSYGRFALLLPFFFYKGVGSRHFLCIKFWPFSFKESVQMGEAIPSTEDCDGFVKKDL
jgi:hypothetical protein